MKKRFLAMTLALLLAFSILPMAALAIGEDGGEIDFGAPQKTVVVTEPEQETPSGNVEPTSAEKAKARVDAIGEDIANEEEPFFSFSFESVLSLIGEMFRAAASFVSTFFTVLFNGQLGS